MAADKEFNYEVIKDLGTIEEPNTGYDTRVKIISWNGGEPKLDIRKWNKDNDKMSKGISISLDAAYVLREVLDKLNLSSLEVDEDEEVDYEPDGDPDDDY